MPRLRVTYNPAVPCFVFHAPTPLRHRLETLTLRCIDGLVTEREHEQWTLAHRAGLNAERAQMWALAHEADRWSRTLERLGVRHG